MKLTYTPNPEIALFKDLSESILTHKSQGVTVFLCGGSTIKAYQYFVEKFDSFLTMAKAVGITDFSFLTFALTDDRWFEDLDNENINYNVIAKTGFYDKFAELGAKSIEMSRSENKEADAQSYNTDIDRLMKNSYKILIGGVGKDGHTCGILPQKSEDDYLVKYGRPQYSTAVEVENIHPNRITLTRFALELMDESRIYMTGEDKSQVLHDLFFEEKEEYLMPSQMYKQFNNVTVYTDIVLK